MSTNSIKRNFPENMALKDQIKASGRSSRWYANQLNVSEKIISDTINGKYKGTNIVPKLLKLINQ